ncbi:MAG: DUF481 domain-containing protein [Acidobacteriota bacterium]
MVGNVRFMVLQAVFWGAMTLASAQTPAPEPVWTGSAGAGLALTGGNSDTANYSLSLDLKRDPKTRNVMKFAGVYLRGSQNKETTVDRLSLDFRDDYKLDERTFAYGEFSYFRDPFKAIDYLMNPQGGIGYRLVATDRLALDVTGGLGVAWEKDPNLDVATSGTVNGGQTLSYKLSESAAITQSVAALWKMDDFGDSLYHFAVGLSSALTKRSELKIDLIDDFRSQTPSPEIKKNDYALIASLLFKF